MLADTATAGRPASALDRSNVHGRTWHSPSPPDRQAADPDDAVLEFLESTYDAAAELGRWDRQALERSTKSVSRRAASTRAR
jgi:hypothetical protein